MTLNDFLSEWNNHENTVKVRTSGSTGIPKEMLVEKERMLASAKATCDFLGLKEGDTALLCMPLDYIAGKMMVVRSIERGLKLIDVEPSSHPLDDVEEHVNFAAFVPLQVHKSLDCPKLKAIDNIIIGGGAIDEALEKKLRAFPNNIYSSYGMTETLSHIALRRVSGENASLWYSPLQGVTVSLNEESCIVINAPYVCAQTLVTNDIGEVNAQGQFRVLGRKDNVINSGGVKVQIEEVEKVLSESLEDNYNDSYNYDCRADRLFIITSAPDAALGEEVVMLLREDLSAEDEKVIEEAIGRLPKYWKPRRIVKVKELPMTETGKPKRDIAKQLV